VAALRATLLSRRTILPGLPPAGALVSLLEKVRHVGVVLEEIFEAVDAHELAFFEELADPGRDRGAVVDRRSTGV
jgi:hypothetical protein